MWVGSRLEQCADTEIVVVTAASFSACALALLHRAWDSECLVGEGARLTLRENVSTLPAAKGGHCFLPQLHICRSFPIFSTDQRWPGRSPRATRATRATRASKQTHTLTFATVNRVCKVRGRQTHSWLFRSLALPESC